MTAPLRSALLLPLLVGCASGDWVVTTWGEEYIEEGIPAAEFEDGCSATFDTFTVALTEAALLDDDGEVVGEVAAGSFEMTDAGPQTVGAVSVPAGTYTAARFAVSPDGGPSVAAAGAVTCGAETVTFDWTFDTATTYICAPAALEVPADGEAGTELTIHGDHFFYDGLEAADAGLQGQPFVDADADADGRVTLEELAAVDVAALGHTVGQYSDITDLAAFVTHLTQTLGHVDGEGHCDVSL